MADFFIEGMVFIDGIAGLDFVGVWKSREAYIYSKLTIYDTGQSIIMLPLGSMETDCFISETTVKIAESATFIRAPPS